MWNSISANQWRKSSSSRSSSECRCEWTLIPFWIRFNNFRSGLRCISLAHGNSDNIKRVHCIWCTHWSSAHNNCSSQSCSVAGIKHTIENQTWSMECIIVKWANSTPRSFRIENFHPSTIQSIKSQERHCNFTSSYCDSTRILSSHFACLFAITTASKWSMLCCWIWQERFLCEWTVSIYIKRSRPANCRSDHMSDATESNETWIELCTGRTEFHVCWCWSWQRLVELLQIEN